MPPGSLHRFAKAKLAGASFSGRNPVSGRRLKTNPKPLTASFQFLLRNPFVGTGFEQVQGQGSAIEHFIVKGAEVELGS